MDRQQWLDQLKRGDDALVTYLDASVAAKVETATNNRITVRVDGSQVMFTRIGGRGIGADIFLTRWLDEPQQQELKQVA
jgi:hypothetical protein